jgi:hypothetical protein
VVSQNWYNNDIVERFEPFLKTAKRKGIGIFAGAGISVAPPSSCPTWDNLKREILRSLLARLLSDIKTTKEVEELSPAVMRLNMRPELFITCLTSLLDRSFVVEMLRGLNSGEPNLNHSLIALLAREHILKSIITTNFDNYIERELNNSEVNYSLLRDDDEIATQHMYTGSPLLVFKPHGCLSKPSSLRMRLDEIQILSNPKKSLLQQLTKGIPLLITGYSGNDEDFFPVLEESIQGNPTESCIVIYPGSSPGEPIQRMSLSKYKKLQIITSSTTDILQMLAYRLIPAKRMASFSFSNGHNIDEGTDWKKSILMQVNILAPVAAAACIAHIVYTSGNYRLSLSFVDIARHYSESNEEPIFSFLERAEMRARKELDGYKGLLDNPS